MDEVEEGEALVEVKDRSFATISERQDTMRGSVEI